MGKEKQGIPVVRNRKKVTVSKVIGLGLLVFLVLTPWSRDKGLAASSSSVNGNESDYPERMGIRERAEELTGKKWIETADAVLNQHQELEWPRYLKTALNLPDWVDFAIDSRTRFEVMDHSVNTTSLGRTDPQVALRNRVRLGLGGDGPVRFLFEGQDSRSYLNGDPGDFRNTTTVNEWDILQVLGSLTAHNFWDSGWRTDFHFGRMTLDFGRRRLIARNDFRNTTNAFDGFHWQISDGKDWRVRAFLTEPVIRDDVQLDGQTKKSLFWGTYVESMYFPWLKMNAYYFGLNDRQTANLTAHRTFSTFGVRLYKSPTVAEVDYEWESAYQTGTRGVTDHFAHFQHLDLGYTFPLPWTPRLLLHYDYVSGDHNPNDQQDQRFDTLFGARRFEYMPTGIVGPFFRTNMTGGGWRIITTPAKGWRIQIKQRFWYLAQSRDTFGSSGLRDPSGNAGKHLGHDLELRVQWAVIQNLDFEAGYWHWFKGSYFDKLPAAADLPPGGNKDTDYFYLQMRVQL